MLAAPQLPRVVRLRSLPYLRLRCREILRFAKKMFVAAVERFVQLQLGIPADSDRLEAMSILLRSVARSYSSRQWWQGLPRTTLKLLAPRGLLGFYRRLQVGRSVRAS